ncbi:PQQ-binding-like beta-propeller repeat protein [bacterium]|nr:PQQ-binding-like beta-propeller repeat protein [bacterium]
MAIHRRQFLIFTGLGLASYLCGCARPPQLRPRKIESWDARTGATLESREISLPTGDWEALDPSGHGFLLASGQSVLALDGAAQWHLYEGPSDALWVRPDLVVTGQNSSSTGYRISAQEFPGGRERWHQDRNSGFLLGFTADAVYVGHEQGVSCFDLESGKEVWKNPNLLELKSAYVEPKSLVLGQGNTGKVSWVDLKTGLIQRTLFTNSDNNRVVLLVGDGKTTLTFTRHQGLAGYRADSRTPVWAQSLDNSDRSKLLGYSEGIALIDLYDSTAAVDITSGRTLWGDSLTPRVSICREVVLITRGLGLGAGEFKLELQARDLRSGRPIWKRELADLEAVTAVNGDKFAVLTV